MNGKFTLIVGLFVVGAVLPVSASSQIKPNATAAEVGLYAGPDRLQKLIDGAKKEGELNLYTSAQSDDMGALVGAFEKKYGIKVSVWRASSEKGLPRAVAEARAHPNTAAIVATNRPQMEPPPPEKVLPQAKAPPYPDPLAP